MVGEKRRSWLVTLLLYLTLAIITIATLFPFMWMLVSSIKAEEEIMAYPIIWWPKTPLWHNYKDIWTRINLLQYVENSVILAVVVTFLQVITSSFAAYAFAKLRFRGRNALFLAYFSTIAVPWQAYMVPQFIIMSKYFHLNNTLWSMIFLQAFSAFGVFLMRQFFLGIPDELCEAARIDGLSEYGIWSRIMLPNAKPAIMTLVIFTIITTWNDFLGPYIYLTRDSVKTIQIGLRMFNSQYNTSYGLVMAASTVTLIPLLIVFLAGQKQFVQGVAMTGIKG
ncbi:MAG: carbohydrate ABC transporter permease [Oscillospiraceae bacterium]|jgi:multiple sugar transport system permease protein|nr:carbohydrate ABC transporter permease [Oscillospiraceae bacterium]